MLLKCFTPPYSFRQALLALSSLLSGNANHGGLRYVRHFGKLTLAVPFNGNRHHGRAINMLPTKELLLNPGMLKDVQILVVDNDRDSRDLYAFLLDSYGAKVTALGSIKEALDLLHWCIPALLICEMRFLGESVDPLIQHVRDLALSSGSMIPILITSTCSLANLAQPLQIKIEAYLLKPINIDFFVEAVWNLTHRSKLTSPSKMQGWMMKTRLKGAKDATLAEDCTRLEAEAAVKTTEK